MAWLTVDADFVSFLPELLNTFGTVLLGPLLKGVPLTDIVEERHAKTAGRQHQVDIDVQESTSLRSSASRISAFAA